MGSILIFSFLCGNVWLCCKISKLCSLAPSDTDLIDHVHLADFDFDLLGSTSAT